MPYLQIDVPNHHSAEQKQRLAKRLGEIYSEMMQANARRVSVAIRELGDGGIWRCTEAEPYPAALLMCDIRRGRPPEQRARLARALVEAIVEILGLRVDQINVEFTQHAGDEMYHPLLGGLSDDWAAGET
ncbi:tautomerase family protein [Bradyrhizobium icense]|uniref:Tautomerase n=1 Tax=Bradyrhizobium icense TaxID=1274631 RepID=A0A1B1UBN4_9BRAD|nr:tautomerase family protein [Bradyrhizobium icense]ANW00164.1 tautomerase [Bradyrhizobium icense]